MCSSDLGTEKLPHRTTAFFRFCSSISAHFHLSLVQLDGNNLRNDLAQRPELTQSTVEIVAPDEYMVQRDWIAAAPLLCCKSAVSP